MRFTSIHVFIIVSVFCTSYATSPTSVPWPVGSTVGMMSETKPLMSSYGDRANGWESFHAGIDIDENTEAVNGDYVRCVAHGYVSLMQPNGTGNGWDILISPVLHGSTGWCYAHVMDPHYSNPENDGWVIDEEIFPGDLIQLMNVNGSETHLHFSWEDIYDIGTGLFNPLDYLSPEPEGNNYWHFNPDGLPQDFKHLFIIDATPFDWSGWSIQY